MARAAALFWALLLCVAAPLTSAAPDVKSSRVTLPGAFIYEFEDGKDTGDFYNKLKGEGKTRLELNYKLFKGVSVQLDDVEEAEEAEERAFRIASSVPAVKNVWPVVLYDIPRAEKKSVAGNLDPASIRPSPQLSRRADNTSDGYAPHVLTQVDKLQADGITGKGVKVAVIDTGIDYTHPDLGGCFGPGCLVSFGTDLVGDAYVGSNRPVPDDDPMDCEGHGTHVAGIIAAKKNRLGFLGAAPDVDLGIYKVFGCTGSAGNDVLIAAFNEAYEAGADVITASIGGSNGWPDEPWSRAVSAIVDQGVPCTLSAGNDGALGLFFASTAATGLGVASISSFDNPQRPSFLSLSDYTVDGGEPREFGYAPAIPLDWGGVNLPLWAPDLDVNVPDGGCDPYPDDTPDLSGFIVLVRRGSCLFTQKAENAVAHGAKYIIIYNNVPGVLTIDFTDVPGIVAGAMVTAQVGERWINLLRDGSDVVLNVTDPRYADVTLITTPNTATGGAASAFTSWGPTWDFEQLYPSFGAPGGYILSTYPVAYGSYAVLSGTSMSCPLVAAAYALYIQATGTRDPDVIRAAFSAESNPQFFNDGSGFYSFLAPNPQEGAGIIQAYDAVHSTSAVYPESLSFGDERNFKPVLNFTLSNNGGDDVTYDISHVPTVTMYTMEADAVYPAAFPNEPVDSPASLSFSDAKVTVPAGGSVTIEISPTKPGGIDDARLPVWSGWVAVNGSDGSSLSVPYNGVSGSLYDHHVVGPQNSYVSQSVDEFNDPVAPNTTFVLPAPGTTPTGEVNYPVAVVDLTLGTRILKLEAVFLGNSVDTTEKSLGPIAGSPFNLNPRSINAFTWNARLANGYYAPPGLYKFVFTALRIGHDPAKEESWDTSETPTFILKYQGCASRKRRMG